MLNGVKVFKSATELFVLPVGCEGARSRLPLEMTLGSDWRELLTVMASGGQSDIVMHCMWITQRDLASAPELSVAVPHAGGNLKIWLVAPPNV
ncbi:hypothetical protein NDU88_003003 [Pleurodeles waltl]|uniref:Uncharacterized protein n=1 Tax=Pleurodeles waltl TaxID=8319 RepID=A0AAV7QE92_PLEWA|nr:hypothetical protein NDU88_003003 [Pleurodeles waltl]